jgi:hypothetical protein
VARYSGSGRAAIRIDIEGLEGLTQTLGLTARDLNNAVQTALRGRAGEALAAEMKSRTPIGKGSFGSHTRDDIDVHDKGPAGGVLVGYQGGLSGGHNGGGRLQKGAWLESGIQPHEISVNVDTKAGGQFGRSYSTKRALKFNGVVRDTVKHPGSRPQKIADKSMKSAKEEVLDWIVDEINDMAGRNGWQGGYVGL